MKNLTCFARGVVSQVALSVLFDAACDDVMHKIGKPRGLIDYMTLSDEVRERNSGPITACKWSL